MVNFVWATDYWWVGVMKKRWHHRGIRIHLRSWMGKPGTEAMD